MKYYVCLLFLISFTHYTYTSAPYSQMAVPPGDNNYYIHETKNYRIIFDQQYLKDIDFINQKVQHYLSEIHHFQNTEPKEPINVILLSARNQRSNALASLLPFTQINIFPSGVESEHHLWLDFLLVHELNHIYQMSHSYITPRFLNKIIKFPLFLFLLAPYPNIALPSLFIEGDAVFKESLFKIGGRLYKGSIRAMVYAQIKKYRNRADSMAKALTNTMLKPHSKTGHYNHGAYLFSALEKRFSHQKINDFFKQNAIRSTFASITFNHALMDVFNMDISELTHFYIQQYARQAYLQRSSPRPALFKSTVCKPFNKLGRKFFFLTANYISTPYLRIYNSRLKKWVHKQVDLPLGKVFKIKGKYYSRASTSIQPHIQLYSLFSEGIYPNSSYNSKYVQDIRQGRVLYVDTNNTLLTYSLYLDDQLYDHIHSNALFDSQHNIYYFKQKGSIRILYKNKQPVFSYQGYDGQLMDIDQHGDIFFTAPTHYGSSIYRYSKGKVTRSSSSDTIIYGTKINDDEMLVCEVTADSYDYKIIPIESKNETPAIYHYHFEKTSTLKPGPLQEETLIPPRETEVLESPFEEKPLEEEFQEPPQLTNTPDFRQENRFLSSQTTELKMPDLKYRKYNSFSKMRFSNWMPLSTDIQSILSLNPWKTAFRSSVLFTDYLQKHYINLAYEVHSLLFHRVFLAYENLTYPLYWNIGYNASFLTWNYKNANHVFPEDMHTGHLIFGYPLFKKGRWFSKLRSTQIAVYGHYNKDHHLLSHLKKTKQIECTSESCGLTKFKWIGNWNSGYTQRYPFAYSFQKGLILDLSIEYDYTFQLSKHDVSFQGELHSAWHLGYEFYIFPKMKYTTALTADTYPIHTSISPPWIWNNTHHSFVFNNTVSDLLKDLLPFKFSNSTMLFEAISEFTASVSFKKAFHTPIYFSNFPLSLVRIIPVFTTKYTVLERPKQFKADIEWSFANSSPFLEFIEFSAGLEMELLLYYNKSVIFSIFTHGFSLPVRWMPESYSSFNPGIYFLIKAPY